MIAVKVTRKPRKAREVAAPRFVYRLVPYWTEHIYEIGFCNNPE